MFHNKKMEFDRNIYVVISWSEKFLSMNFDSEKFYDLCFFKAHPVSDYLPHLLKIQNFILRGFRRKLGNVILQISVNQKRYFYCFSLTITLNIGKF